MYADGDIGDMNHEAHVEQLVTNEILSYFDLELDEFKSFDLADYYNDIKEIIKENLPEDDIDEDSYYEDFDEKFDFDPKQYIEDYIVKEYGVDRNKISKMLYMRDA